MIRKRETGRGIRSSKNLSSKATVNRLNLSLKSSFNLNLVYCFKNCYLRCILAVTCSCFCFCTFKITPSLVHIKHVMSAATLRNGRHFVLYYTLKLHDSVFDVKGSFLTLQVILLFMSSIYLTHGYYTGTLA